MMQPIPNRTLPTILIVALPALLLGACAGAIVQPALPVPAGVAVEAETVMTLPIREFALEELMQPMPTEPVVAVEDPPGCDIPAVIHGLADDTELASASLAVGTGTHRYTEVRVGTLRTYRDQEYDIALRVLDTTTCTTEIVTVRKTYGTRTLAVPVATKGGTVWREQVQPAALLRAPAGWDIEVVRRANGIEWNNWATDFHIAAPSNRVVVGLKFPLINEQRTKGQSRVTEVLYVPVGRDLLAMAGVRQALADEGLRYATELAERAFSELRAAGVPSRAVDGARVADIPQLSPRDFVYRMAVEHMDQMEFTLDPLWTTDRIFAVIGANRERFATLTCSPASACGPMQFTSGTYRHMDASYPSAGLTNSFTEGVKDHLNVMKAAILLDDYNLAKLASVFGLAPMREERLAAYNTGVGRTIAVRRVAERTKTPEWTDARGRCSIANRYAECFLAETKGYVVKYRYLEDAWHDERIAFAP